MQNTNIKFRARPCSTAPSGAAAQLALQLWQLAEHLPVQLAAEALAAAVVLRQQEVSRLTQLSLMRDMHITA